MLSKIVLLLMGLHVSYGNPQFLTFKDGRIGVNFGGYHAQAGLGGLLTGNAAHGGLSASAGTPFGQNAGAGIGGNLNDPTSGGAYAGATAGKGIGANAVLGGILGGNGNSGIAAANSYAGGVEKSISITGEKANAQYSNSFSESAPHSSPDNGNVQYISAPQEVSYVQKIEKLHPHKVFYTNAQAYSAQNNIPNLQYSLGLAKVFNVGLFGKKAHLFRRRNVGTGTTTTKTTTDGSGQPETDAVPKITYEKHVYHKHLLPKTIVVHKPFIDINRHKTLTIHKEIKIGNSGKTVTSTVDNEQTVDTANNEDKIKRSTNINKGQIFDDIFNIPISTLQAVNRLVTHNI